MRPLPLGGGSGGTLRSGAAAPVAWVYVVRNRAEFNLSIDARNGALLPLQRHQQSEA
jgi:hypothetical protein